LLGLTPHPEAEDLEGSSRWDALVLGKAPNIPLSPWGLGDRSDLVSALQGTDRAWPGGSRKRSRRCTNLSVIHGQLCGGAPSPSSCYRRRWLRYRQLIAGMCC